MSKAKKQVDSEITDSNKAKAKVKVQKIIPRAKGKTKTSSKPHSTASVKSASKKNYKAKVKPVIIDVIEDEDEKSAFPDLPHNYINEGEIFEIEESNNFNIKPLDKQEKFFSELINEIKENNPELQKKKLDTNVEDKNRAPRNSLSLYKRLVWRFVLGIGALLIIVLYFSFSKLTITIFPTGETINDNMLVRVVNNDEISDEQSVDFREVVTGKIEKVVLNEEKTFSASGEEFIGEEISGLVKIINTTSKAQALIATTRLLSPDNKLFRLKESVNVPASGEVEVEIYVDKPSEDLAINPTSFTIPGLWVGLQDKIFAKSTESFVYRQKINKYIKTNDIEQAISEMNAILLAKAKNTKHKEIKNPKTIYEFIGSTEFDYNAKAGENKDSFNVKASSTLISLTFSQDDISRLTNAKLNLLVPDDKKLMEQEAENIIYKFENYDENKNEATLKLSYTGVMILKSDTNLIDKKQLVNLNKPQLENYLKNFSEIKNYDFKFFPSFINRAPWLPERIEIKIKGMENS